MVVDVTTVLDSIPAARWPLDPGDLLIANFDRLRGLIDSMALSGVPRHLADCALKSPVANPSKILGALKNYHAIGNTDLTMPATPQKVWAAALAAGN